MISQVNIYMMDHMDGYCMDIMCLFMWGGQNSWFSKASLRICYVSLFESKGP